MADDAQAVLAKKGVDVGDPSFSSDGRKIFFVAE
jgi:Tol biopolymer transport system component